MDHANAGGVKRAMCVSALERGSRRIPVPMSAFGTKRTCRGRLTMSAPEGKTDVPRERGHFRFWTHNGHRPACHAAEAKPLQPLSMDQMRHYDAMSRAWGTSWPRQLLLVSPPQCRKRKSIANPIAVTR